MGSRGETIVDKGIPSRLYSGPGNGRICTLDDSCTRAFMQIYCSCGRIVSLDRSEMQLKMKLGKDLECASCRNFRISAEIDMMNDHFSGIIEQDAL